MSKEKSQLPAVGFNYEVPRIVREKKVRKLPDGYVFTDGNFRHGGIGTSEYNSAMSKNLANQLLGGYIQDNKKDPTKVKIAKVENNRSSFIYIQHTDGSVTKYFTS